MSDAWLPQPTGGGWWWCIFPRRSPRKRDASLAIEPVYVWQPVVAFAHGSMSVPKPSAYEGAEWGAEIAAGRCRFLPLHEPDDAATDAASDEIIAAMRAPARPARDDATGGSDA